MSADGDSSYKSYVQRAIDAFMGSASPQNTTMDADTSNKPGISLHNDFSKESQQAIGRGHLSLRHKAADLIFYGVRPGMQGGNYVVINPQGQKNPHTGERAFTPEQIKRALMQLVIDQGCTKIYCFKGNKSDMNLRSQVMGALIDLQTDRRYAHIFNRVSLELPFEKDYKAFEVPWATGALRNIMLPVTRPIAQMQYDWQMLKRDTKHAWAGHRYKDLPPAPPKP